MAHSPDSKPPSALSSDPDLADWARRGSSAIQGAGVFAVKNVPRGTPVCSFGGPIVSGADIRDDDYVLQIGDDAYIQGDPQADFLENYINHSCEPNLGFRNGGLVLYALRDIAQGEELTWDYSTSMHEPGVEIACQCESASCRGVIRSFLELDAQTRARLLPHCIDFIRRRAMRQSD